MQLEMQSDDFCALFFLVTVSGEKSPGGSEKAVSDNGEPKQGGRVTVRGWDDNEGSNML